jgi:uncharacterized membrane protein YfcA
VIAGWGNPMTPPYSLGFVSIIGFALIAPTTVLVAPVGAKLAHSMSQRNLNLVFGIFLMVAALRMATHAI